MVVNQIDYDYDNFVVDDDDVDWMTAIVFGPWLMLHDNDIHCSCKTGLPRLGYRQTGIFYHY